MKKALILDVITLIFEGIAIGMCIVNKNWVGVISSSIVCSLILAFTIWFIIRS